MYKLLLAVALLVLLIGQLVPESVNADAEMENKDPLHKIVKRFGGGFGGGSGPRWRWKWSGGYRNYRRYYRKYYPRYYYRKSNNGYGYRKKHYYYNKKY